MYMNMTQHKHTASETWVINNKMWFLVTFKNFVHDLKSEKGVVFASVFASDIGLFGKFRYELLDSPVQPWNHVLLLSVMTRNIEELYHFI